MVTYFTEKAQENFKEKAQGNFTEKAQENFTGKFYRTDTGKFDIPNAMQEWNGDFEYKIIQSDK